MVRRSNTARDIVSLGEFVKVGRKRYMHAVSGLMIHYDHNNWCWVTPDGSTFKPLHAAVSWFRSQVLPNHTEAEA
ncbi:hypothetical protein [Roseomonas sp. USHLN139]|uniref:hypothetical protein n=1 Tax=Roseomonas sp. USHLN139 TaxID=3081298 RepID=UPI003B023862